jgi:fatty acid desaturase
MLIHEVSHLAKKILGYRFVYNLFFGWPNSYPAYIYDTHLFHHGKKTYATHRDPEYKYIPEYNLQTLIRPLFTAALLPFFQLIRFGIMPLIEGFLPREIRLKILRTYSTLVFSLDYVRPIRNEDKGLKEMLNNDLICAFYKLTFIGLVIVDILPVRSLLYFYLAFVISSLFNMYRALFNHLYSNESSNSLSWEEHLVDTVTIKPSLITSMIFINGLNYHSLHHLFPDLPYLNLGKAHRKLMDTLPDDHIYKANVFNNIVDVIKFNFSESRKNKILNLS